MTARADTHAASARPQDAGGLLRRLRAEGFSLWIEGDALKVAPVSALAAADRAALKAAKPQILALLRIEAPPIPAPQQPADPQSVCCGTCRHGVAPPDTDPAYGWRRCAIGKGGGFARAAVRCEGFAPAG